MARDTKSGRSRTSILMALLVVVATATAIYLLGNDVGDDRENAAPVVQDALEVTPGIPDGAIVSASWRADDGSKEAAAPESDDEGASTSLLDGVEWGDESDRRERFEKSLEETVREIHGLGVYVDTSELEEGK